MKKILCTMLAIIITLNAQALFEVKDTSDHSVFEIANDGIRIFNYPDTLMIISSSEIRANLDNSKGLSRSFSVSTNTTSKAANTNVLEVTTGSTYMSEGGLGFKYTDFSPENMFLGLHSGESNVSGVNNVFLGNYSGYSADDINASIFIGVNAGYYQNANHGNVYVGQSAGMYMESGGSNVFIGTVTGMNQVSGEDNVIIGAGAADMLYESGTHIGSNNVVLGAEAGDALNGDNNVFIGYGAGYGYLGSNSLHIANSATTTPLIKGTFPNTDLTFTSNKVSVVHPFGTTNGLYIQSSYNNNTDSWHFYQGSTDVLYLYFNTSWRGQWNTTTGVYTSVSDAKFKKNIEDLSKVIDKVMLLQPKKYNFTSQKDSEKKYIGMIAQDVEKLFPEFVYFNEEEQAFSMDYAGLSVVAIQAIKEQQDKINEQETKIEKLESRLELIEQLLNK
ncbi:MAG: tail fiber domain-containing protein [Candidatus Delongbacteria bacterium]|jgi:hypothetical protein|nr:tail fiber domain-containing protein [Candidatus Delongbacteria bacterium]